MRCVYYYFLILLGLISLVRAIPTLNEPLNEQHPPVARVGAEFRFTALPDTFTTNSTSPLNYTASSLPSWLKFAPQPPTFTGTPSAADVGEQTVHLVAIDDTGSRNASFKIIVSDKAAPVLVLPFDKQLADNSTRQFASAKVSPDARGVTVPPFWSFSLGWSGETFKRPDSNGNGKLYYSAYVRGESVLPDWLKWSNTSFTFNGVAPANGTFPVVVTATDLWGYKAAETSFILSVGEGAAVESTGNWTDVTSISRNYISKKLDLSSVNVGGKPAQESQLSLSADLSNHKWLSFDKTTNTLSGVTPDNLVNGTASPLSIPITISSSNTSNTLSTVSFLSINVLPYAFKSFDFPSQRVTAGQYFQHSVGDMMVNKTAPTGASVIPGEAAQYLMVFPENQTVVGNLPPNITYSAIDITFVANTSAGVASTANVTFTIDGVTGPKGQGEPAPIPEGKVNHGLSKTKKIIIGVVVGVGGLLVLLALLLLCCCRRRKRDARRSYASSKETSPDTLQGTPRKVTKSASSSPERATLTERPKRFSAFRSLFGGADTPTTPTKTKEVSPEADNYSFTGSGELVAVGHTNQGNVSAITRDGTSFDSIASWQSAPSVHWSGENEYLEPLYESDAGQSPRIGANSRARATPSSDRTAGVPPTPRTPATPSTAAAADITTPTFGTSPQVLPEVPRPKRGFYPKYPRNVQPGDPVPVLSSDQVPSSHFSEFDRDFSSENGFSRRSLVASQSLDSFADPGSQVGSSRFGSAHSRSGNSNANGWWKSHSGGRPLSGIASHMSEGSLASGEWFNPQESALTRLASSGLVSGSTFSSSEPAIVTTAQRQSLETQRPRIRPEVDTRATTKWDYTLPNFSNPTTGSQSIAARRQSSRRPGPRLHSTREHIVSTAISPPPTPAVPENLVVEHANRLSEVDDPERMIMFSQPLPARGESPFFHAS